MSNFKQLGLGLFCLLMLMAAACKKDKPSNSQPAEPQHEYGTVTDIEGNVYKTVKIGDQWWMEENLKTHKLNDGTPIPYVKSYVDWTDPNNTVPMMCYYDNDELTNRDKYGALYNRHAVLTGKLAPAGWHVPTDADWQKMKNYLIVNGYNFDGTALDNKIGKSLASTTGWLNNPEFGTVGNSPEKNNKSGFNAMPGGSRNDGTYGGVGYFAEFWSADQNTVNGNWWYLKKSSAELIGSQEVFSSVSGYSVRCVKD